MKFGWDELKNQINIKKHNVSFEDAETVFQDIFQEIELYQEGLN